MVECSERNISGTWFGNYYYSDLSQACGFEAVFLQQGAALEGSILDDGKLGEAYVSGSSAGGQVSFRKAYNNRALEPVLYQGMLSDDGKALSGTWRINGSVHGSWKAWRMDGEELPQMTETEDELSPERELAPLMTRSTK